jgi:hypothetical protein
MAALARSTRANGPSIDAPGLEMPPAAVNGDLQVGIALANHLHDIRGDLGQPLLAPVEMRGAAFHREACDLRAVHANRAGGEQLGGGMQGGRGAHAEGFPGGGSPVPGASSLEK